MKNTFLHGFFTQNLGALIFLAVLAPNSFAATARLIEAAVTSNTASDDLFSASHISDSSGLSGDPNGAGGASVTHSGYSDETAWVTKNGGEDYYASGDNLVPVLIFDFGHDRTITGFSYWAYAYPFEYEHFLNNSAKDITLRFASEADGSAGFGTSILANLQFELLADVEAGMPSERQDFEFIDWLTARYVEVTVTDNHYGSPGGFGGDRVGMGELQFAAVPEINGAQLGIALTLLLSLVLLYRERDGFQA